MSNIKYKNILTKLGYNIHFKKGFSVIYSLLFFITFSYSQSNNYFELDKYFAYSKWKELKVGLERQDLVEYAKIFNDKNDFFSYGIEFPSSSGKISKSNIYFKYDFNDSGFITSFAIAYPFSMEKWVDEKMKFKSSNIKESGNFKITIIKENDGFVHERLTSESRTWTANNLTFNVTEILEKVDLPRYNKKKTRLLGNTTFIRRMLLPNSKGTGYLNADTNFGEFDLKDEAMLYRIEDYVLAFILDVQVPILFNSNYISGRANKPAELNQNDMDFLAEIGNGIENPKKIVEFKDLPENVIALSMGNAFETGYFHIVIDPIKFRQASPAKRAFIIWHEGYHCLGLEHGECGKLMFPYADRDYTWKDWNDAREETISCWIEKRNFISSEKN